MFAIGPRHGKTCRDAQAGLRLCFSQTTEDRFPHLVAHLIVDFFANLNQLVK